MELTKLDQIRADEARLLLSTYDRNPILFVGGEDVYLIDEKGDRYLDLLSGIGVNALGYSHPAILEAIAKQSRRTHSHLEPLLSQGPGGACTAAH
jgi:acetylornithine/N-succinyldiaminopimelate aminotransferase